MSPAPAPAAPRRRPRGARRRAAIVEAALELVAESGAGALTHRAVAEAAGVPLAATTYYFESKRDLLHETLRAASDLEAAAARRDAAEAGLDDVATAADLAEALARMTVRYLADRPRALALYEIYLAAAREPELAEAAAAWSDAYAELLEPVLARLGAPAPALDARIVTHLLDGLVADELAGPRPGFERERLRPALARAVSALAGPRQEVP